MRYNINIDYFNLKWYKDDLHHRLCGPAVEYFDGGRYWSKNGCFHREDGPALEWPNGRKEWLIDGEFCTKEQFNKEIQSGKI